MIPSEPIKQPRGSIEQWRLFIAIEVPHDLLRIVKQTQDELKASIPSEAVKWVRPDGIHLTLKFLGDVPVSKVDDVIAEMQESVRGLGPFFLNIEGLGCFPNTRNPRVLWLGLTGNVRNLAILQTKVEEHIAPLGYPSEDRAFHPHLTLARAAREARREEVNAMGRAAEYGVGTLGSWRVDGISLMRSQLHRDGAIYTQEASIMLDR